MEVEIVENKLVSVIGTDEEFSIPEGIVTIENQCFKNCPNLKTLYIPDGVEHIGEYAFYGCPELKFLNLPKTLKWVEQTFLCGCKYVDTIEVGAMPAFTFGELERTVYRSTMSVRWNGGGFDVLDGPNPCPSPVITRVRKIFFESCCEFNGQPWISDEGLCVHMGDYDPFSMVEVEEFEVEEGNTDLKSIDGVLYNRDATILLRCPSAIDRREISMTEYVMVIGNHAFANCRNIEHINMSPRIQMINWAAFQCCVNLQEIFVPYYFQCVNNHYESTWIAYGCENLKNIIAPARNVTCFNPGVAADWYVFDKLIKDYEKELPVCDPQEWGMGYGVNFKAVLPLSTYPKDGWLPDWFDIKAACEELKNTDALNIMYRGEEKDGSNLYGPITHTGYTSLMGHLSSPVREDKSRSRNPSSRRKHKK